MAYNESPVTVPRFILVRGVTNNWTLYIKARGSLDALELKATDTFVAHIREKNTGETVVSGIPLTIGNPKEGEVKLSLTPTNIAPLERDVGTKANRSYLKPHYSLLIEANTANQGSFLIRVEDVYID